MGRTSFGATFFLSTVVHQSGCVFFSLRQRALPGAPRGRRWSPIAWARHQWYARGWEGGGLRRHGGRVPENQCLRQRHRGRPWRPGTCLRSRLSSKERQNEAYHPPGSWSKNPAARWKFMWGRTTWGVVRQPRPQALRRPWRLPARRSSGTLISPPPKAR